MKNLWSDRTVLYNSEYEKAQKMDISDLYNKIILSVRNIKNKIHFYDSDYLSATMLVSTGCCHQKKNACLSGCSMCDYYSDQIPELAMINALKDRDSELYKQAVLYSFTNTRGNKIIPKAIETVTTYNIFDKEAFPPDLFDTIFLSDKTFTHRPLKMKFETRAPLVDKNTIYDLSKKLGHRVSVSMGVETGCEWIRNHWLNKNIYNHELKTCVDNVHSVGWRAIGNLIIGIPGFTENQTVKICRDSILWMSELGFDEIVVSPLVRKNLTLQNYIFNNLKNNTTLSDVGLVNGEHTGMPFIYTVLRVLYPFLTKEIKIKSVLDLSVFHFPLYKSIIGNYYKNKGIQCDLYEILDALTGFERVKDIKIINQVRRFTEKQNYNDIYSDIIDRQASIRNSRHSLELISEKIAESMFPDSYGEKTEGFKDELDELSDYF